jgi:putative NIF3 family GTP cyclohydrolase 1 type 2
MSRPKKITHAAVVRFVETVLPLKENDVQRLYHVPRNPRYDPETAVVEQIVLSVTPTPGVYSLIGHPLDESTAGSMAYPPQIYPRPLRTLCFLHRPFHLDRRSVRKGTLVLSSHTSFDEVLTVGWNTALAERLGLDTTNCLCVQGYKGDAERKIGVIGQITVPLQVLLSRIQEQFGVSELAHIGLSDEIRFVAIMNAFNEGEVHRIFQMAQERGWIAPEEDGRHLLYLTGQPRVSGLEAAKTLGMSVVCVGHRQAEDWGIRYMGETLRKAFPNAHVEELYEEETPVVKEKESAIRIS